MDQFLNPVGSRHPNASIAEQNPAVSTEETYIEGAEYVPLPSKGVFYTKVGMQYANLDKLKVRQLNYTDEDILTTKSYLDDGSVFFELLKNVIVDENNFPSTGLVAVDRDTILLWLRSTAFGNIFEAETSCPKCSAKQNITWDLSKFVLPEYSPEVYEELQQNGELTIFTPLKDIEVKIGLPTIGMAREFEKLLVAKKTAQKTKTDLFGTGSLMLVIQGVKIDGKIVRKRSEIENYFNKIKLPLVDSRYIRKSVEKLNLKYATAQDVLCSNCDYVQEGVEMPMLHPNFFWPDSGV